MSYVLVVLVLVLVLVVVVVVVVVVDPGHIFETKNINKNTVFSDIFMPFRRKKHWVLRRFCSVKGENRPKTSLFTLFFSERLEHCVLRCFFNKGL